MRDAVLARSRSVFALETIAELPLDPVSVRRVAQVHRLAELGPRDVREVTSDLLLDPAVLAAAVRESLESGCRLWVLAIDETTRLVPETQFIGDLTPLGPSVSDGRRVYGIAPVEVARRLLLAHPEHASVFNEMNADGLPQDVLARLADLRITVRRRSPLARLLRNPRLWIYLVVFVYSALRALPVALVKEFHGSIVVLWAIDIITAIPYAWGILALVAGRTRRIRFLGAVTGVVTFVAPYVYFGLHGHDYPPHVIVVIAAMVLGGVGLETWKFHRESRLGRRYEAAAPECLATSS